MFNADGTPAQEKLTAWIPAVFSHGMVNLQMIVSDGDARVLAKTCPRELERAGALIWAHLVDKIKEEVEKNDQASQG